MCRSCFGSFFFSSCYKSVFPKKVIDVVLYVAIFVIKSTSVLVGKGYDV